MAFSGGALAAFSNSAARSPTRPTRHPAKSIRHPTRISPQRSKLLSRTAEQNMKNWKQSQGVIPVWGSGGKTSPVTRAMKPRRPSPSRPNRRMMAFLEVVTRDAVAVHDWDSLSKDDRRDLDRLDVHLRNHEAHATSGGSRQRRAERARGLWEANRRAAADRLWCVDLQARLAIAGDAPSFNDLKLATSSFHTVRRHSRLSSGRVAADPGNKYWRQEKRTITTIRDHPACFGS